MTTLIHDNGARFVVGSMAPDDAERMACRQVGPFHSMCGVRECCGWPNFAVCPCDPRHHSPEPA